jgi:hypothetical protein
MQLQRLSLQLQRDGRSSPTPQQKARLDAFFKQIQSRIERYRLILTVVRDDNFNFRIYLIQQYILYAEEKNQLEKTLQFFHRKLSEYGVVGSSDECHEEFDDFKNNFMLEYFSIRGEESDLHHFYAAPAAIDEEYSFGTFHRFFSTLEILCPGLFSRLKVNPKWALNTWWIECAYQEFKKNVVPFVNKVPDALRILQTVKLKPSPTFKFDPTKFIYATTNPDGLCFFNSYRDFLGLLNYGKTDYGIAQLRQEIFNAVKRRAGSIVNGKVVDDLILDITDKAGNVLSLPSNDDPELRRLIKEIIDINTATIEAQLLGLLPFMDIPVNYIMFTEGSPQINDQTYNPAYPTVLILHERIQIDGSEGGHYTRLECIDPHYKKQLIEHVLASDSSRSQQSRQQLVRMLGQSRAQQSRQQLVRTLRQISTKVHQQQEKRQAQHAQRLRLKRAQQARIGLKQVVPYFHSHSLSVLQGIAPPLVSRAPAQQETNRLQGEEENF